MRQMMWILILLAAVSFVLGGIGVLVHSPIMGVTPEGFSRASTNLALIAIAVLLAPSRGRREA